MPGCVCVCVNGAFNIPPVRVPVEFLLFLFDVFQFMVSVSGCALNLVF